MIVYILFGLEGWNTKLGNVKFKLLHGEMFSKQSDIVGLTDLFLLGMRI